MATTFSPDAPEKNKDFNAAEKNYEERFNSSPYAQAGLDQLEAFANDPANASANDKNVGEAEREGASNWDVKDMQPKVETQGAWAKVGGFFKKKGGILSVVGVVGVSGGFLAAFVGPGSMLVNVMSNMTDKNDSISTALEVRLRPVLRNITGGNTNGSTCSASAGALKCRMGRVSNSALKKFQKSGITAVFEDGNTYDGKRTGYTSKKITNFKMTLDTGDIVDVEPKNLVRTLSENPKLAYKVLGIKGAFKLRFNTWAGKYISKFMTSKFGITFKGGIADGESDADTSKSLTQRAFERLKGRIKPGNIDTDALEDSIQRKASGKTSNAGKAGIAYSVAYGACVVTKIPSIMAGGIIGIQMLQIAPLISDVILSPASKLQAAGVDDSIDTAALSTDIEEVGTLLTSQTENSDGKMTSALDSKYLQSAMGINSGTTGPSEDYSPGYSLLNNPAYKFGATVENFADPACSVIMSPYAMYAALAAETAIKVAEASTGVGVLIALAQTAIGVGSGYAISAAISQAISLAMPDVVSWVEDHDGYLDNLEGEALGDALGISAMIYFSSGGMAAGLPVLSEEQLPEFAAIKTDLANQQKEMDIATLSPFDTSSQYTFFGNIVHKFSTMLLANNIYSSSFLSTLGTIASIPTLAFSSTVGASSNFDKNYCGYASSFNMTGEDESATPAVNAAGLPCTGITSTQANMSTDEAIQLLIDEGWIDEGKAIEDGATITDLREAGFIKEGTPLTDYLDSCGDPSTGSYVYEAGGCITPGTTLGNAGSYDSSSICSEDNANCLDAGIEETQIKDGRSLAAISVFIMDWQVLQSINGENGV